MDLNADLGELPAGGLHPIDRELLGIVTTAHVACGGHAGDAGSMRRVLAAAVAAGVAVGAHPSYADRPGFGRRPMDLDASVVADQVATQVADLLVAAREEGAVVRSVKPHGALYHRVGRDEACAAAVAGAVSAAGDLVLVLAAGSPTLDVVRAAGVRVVSEGFCDRAYDADGSLLARGQEGALVTDPAEVGRRAVGLATAGVVRVADGSQLAVRCETLCVHSDTPGAVALARAAREALERGGVTVRAFAA